jgi:glyoxylase-like metal-dependent hydrolase (beta-lactamase superfamily II)
MKFHSLLISLFFILGCSSQAEINAKNEQAISQSTVTTPSVIAKKSWIHGAENCEDNIGVTNKSIAFDVYKHDKNTFILRQNKCLTFEAPFIYIFVGNDKILVLDTGAVDELSTFSLYEELVILIGAEQLTTKKILVAHSHSHSDHYSGDIAFKGRSNVEVINTSARDVKQFYGFTQWPNGQSIIELGNRKITVIPTPGHQEESISLHDPHTKWLMTGDTLYPGYIYVKDWQAFQKSITRLTAFTEENEVSAIMGAHIEKQSQGELYYPIGTTYQPNEANLDLPLNSLLSLNAIIKVMNEPQELHLDNFIIKPMNGFQKTLSNIARWFTQ